MLVISFFILYCPLAI